MTTNIKALFKKIELEDVLILLGILCIGYGAFLEHGIGVSLCITGTLLLSIGIGALINGVKK